MRERKYIEYEIVDENIVKRIYQDERPETYNLGMDIIKDFKLPYLLRGGEVRLLEVGIEDG